MRLSLVVVVLLTGLLVLPGVTAAAGIPLAGSSGPCQLSTQAHAGQDIVVSGSAFTPGVDVVITQTWGGSSATQGGAGAPETTTQTVQSDASGAFELTVPAGPGRGGQYTFSATGAGCTATAEVVAIETAGGLHGDGTTGPTQPPTDTAPVTAPPSTDLMLPLLLAIATIFGLVLVGLALVRRPSRRA